MDPWRIIGWIVLAVIAALVLFNVAVLLGSIVKHRVGHWKTRNDTPKVGQVWKDRTGNIAFQITRAADDGGVTLRFPGFSFGQSSEVWKDYVRHYKLRRIS